MGVRKVERAGGGRFCPPFQLAGDWRKVKRFALWDLLRAEVKVDGIRAWWDGERLWSRGGSLIKHPWSGELPAGVALDGEIFGLPVAEVSGAARGGSGDERWVSLGYRVFDLPRHGGVYDERRVALEELGLRGSVSVGEVFRVGDERALAELVGASRRRGEEGLILRLGDGKYVAGEGRRRCVWKLKISREFEAEVVRAVEGTGKNKGRAGKLECVRRMERGPVRFFVSAGLTEGLRDSPPAAGAVVICRAATFSRRDTPISPVFVRVRDVEAEGVGRLEGGVSLGEKGARIAAGLSGSSRVQVSKRTEMISVKRLRMYDEVFGKNPRLHHSDGDLRRIRRNIESDGWLVPVVIDEEDVVLDGNGRLLVAKEMGLAKVPCIRVSGLPVAKKRVAGLNINLTGKLGEDDDRALAYQLGESLKGLGISEEALRELGYDAGVVGEAVELSFDAGRLAALGAELGVLPEAGAGGGEDDEGEGDGKGEYTGFRVEGSLKLTKRDKALSDEFRTVLPVHGGKSALVPILRPLAEGAREQYELTTYYEAFLGGGSLLWSFRAKFDVEIVSDVEDGIVSFWEVMQTQFDEFFALAELRGLHAESYFERAQGIVFGRVEPADKVEKAWGWWYCTVCAGSYDARQNFLIGYEDNKAEKLRARIDKFNRDKMRRLEGVTVMRADCLGLIRRFGAHANVLIYADPPYVGANQGYYAGYGQDKFEALLAELARVQGKFILSSYENDALARFTREHGWHTARIYAHSSAANTHSGGAREKCEVVTTNFPSPFSGGE